MPIDKFIVDFYCHELLLAIEIDGSSHDFNYDNDCLRETLLENHVIKVIRYLDIDIKRNMNDVLRSLENIISELEIKVEKTSP